MAGNICKTVQYGMRPTPEDPKQFSERAFVGLYTEVDMRHADDAKAAEGIVKADALYKQALNRFAAKMERGDWWASVASSALGELDSMVEQEADAKVKNGMAVYLCARVDFISLKMDATKPVWPHNDKTAAKLQLEAELATGSLGRGISRLVEKAQATIQK